jgi:hypothetical protein
MEAGARRLLPIIDRYRAELGRAVLELGPNKHPLMTPESHDGLIVYVEVSEPCIEFLQRTFERAVTVRFDLNEAWSGGTNRFAEAVAAALGPDAVPFDVVIVSQILNYVDFRRVLEACGQMVSPGALVFVNNIMNHGLVSHLHEHRPQSLRDLVDVATELGFETIETVSEPAQVADPAKIRDLAVLRAPRV